MDACAYNAISGGGEFGRSVILIDCSTGRESTRGDGWPRVRLGYRWRSSLRGCDSLRPVELQ